MHRLVGALGPGARDDRLLRSTTEEVGIALLGVANLTSRTGCEYRACRIYKPFDKR